METYEVIRARQSERGISTAELSRRTGIGYEQLRTSLRGLRGINSDEFVALCIELGMTLDDFTERRTECTV